MSSVRTTHLKAGLGWLAHRMTGVAAGSLPVLAAAAAAAISLTFFGSVLGVRRGLGANDWRAGSNSGGSGSLKSSMGIGPDQSIIQE